MAEPKSNASISSRYAAKACLPQSDSPYATSSDDERSASDEEATSRLRTKCAKGSHAAGASSRRTPGLYAAAVDTLNFYRTLAYFLVFGGSFEACPTFKDSPQARAQIYSLVVQLWMYNRPHYRTGTYRDDMLTNLRNVAIPGTGIPLSLVVSSRFFCLVFLLVLYPIIAVVAGFRKGFRKGGLSGATQAYSEQLLCPQDWFSYWRLNCVLASLHASLNAPLGFKQEDKWTFLTDAKAAGVPVSPWLDAECLVIKDKNEEGGMGIHFYKNAVHGGDWIIQTKLSNNGFVSSLLPEEAPLSTLRVITSSKGGLRSGSSSGEHAPLPGPPQRDDVTALSCVFRAGRAGASTDHSSVLFDVDLATGQIQKGTTNMHWYQLGPRAVATTPWVCLDHTITNHPDTGRRVTGHTIPDIEGIRALCEEAHFKLLPDVPLAGWDVALTEEAGMCLLEVNLSCNFFRGTFDHDKYFEFVNEFLGFLDKRRRV